jgi:sulfur relay (sulfurtransferase) DsrC/TusE family protein
VLQDWEELMEPALSALMDQSQQLEDHLALIAKIIKFYSTENVSVDLVMLLIQLEFVLSVHPFLALSLSMEFAQSALEI